MLKNPGCHEINVILILWSFFLYPIFFTEKRKLNEFPLHDHLHEKKILDLAALEIRIREMGRTFERKKRPERKNVFQRVVGDWGKFHYSQTLPPLL